MFPIMSRVNGLAGVVNSLQSQVKTLNDQVSTVSLVQKDSVENDANLKIAKLMEVMEDLKKSLNRVQLDVVTKHNEIKKDIDACKKEVKLLETTLMHKVEQVINKSVKDRTDMVADELKSFVERTITDLVDSSDKEKEEEDETLILN